MFSAIIDGFSVLDDTVLTYNGDESKLVISAKIKSGTIRKIGDGAFYNNKEIREVIIGDGIEVIGKSAFAKASNLKYLFLPKSINKCDMSAFKHCNNLSRIIVDRTIKKSELDSLLTTSIRGEEDKYILSGPHYEISSLAQIYDGLNEIAKPACRVTKDMRRLFLKRMRDHHSKNYRKSNDTDSENIDEKRDKMHMFFQDASICLDVSAKALTENKALIEKIKADKQEPYNYEADEKNDSYLKMQKEAIINEVIVVSFRNNDTVIKGDYAVVRFIFDIDQHFWQSTRRVVVEGETFYVYRREFLNSDPEYPFIRRDVYALDDKFQSISDELERKVYAKYILASMI